MTSVPEPSAELLQRAGAVRLAAVDLGQTSDQQRAQALQAMADALAEHAEAIVAANRDDLERSASEGLAPALMARLKLDADKLAGAIDGVRTMNSGIRVGRMRVPLGVIAIVYESRPNVTIEAASLCLKSGNAAILRGGSEAISSNLALGQCLSQGLVSAGLPATTIQVVETTDRAVVDGLITQDDCIDMVIPRGGKGLIERISGAATVPVLKHLDGICHVYVDAAACPEKAMAIVLNAKTQRYGTCNTLETLLIDEKAIEQLPAMATALAEAGVELRGCDRARAVSSAVAVPATEADWQTEYLAPILAIRVVDGIEGAMDHIARFSSGHTESIVTEQHSTAMRFLREVDSSSVMVNASTRFADGFEYGLGAEIGISTDKLHARGPVGLEGLTSSKYIVFGDGHIRQ